jgi:hypothetical protein
MTRPHPWSRCADTPSCPTDGQEMFTRVMLGKLMQDRSGSAGFIPHRGKGRRGHVCPPPACAVIKRSGAGTVGRTACAPAVSMSSIKNRLRSHCTTCPCPYADRASVGSALHVMLALRHSSREVVVADKQLDSTDMMSELFGKRQRVADQP